MSAMAAMLERSDYLRRSPATVGGAVGHKEWTHFCLFADELDLLVNFSLMDRAHGQVEPLPEVPRLCVLSRDGRWDGDVDEFAADEIEIAGGRIDMRFGENSLRFRDGVYELDVALRSRPVAARLTLRPTARPALASSVRLSRAGAMKWLVVPRLEASGEVVLDGRRHELLAVPAYHDHNWGPIEWGADFSWEWAVALPSDPASPWSLIVMRISDRGRLRTLSQGVLLWRREHHCRTFRGRDVEFATRGLLRPARLLRIPRVMSLVAPGTAANLPQGLDVSARSGGDGLDVAFELGDVAQVGIPSDGEAGGVTLLSEARATVRAEGRIRGERIEFEGPALVEFNRGA